MSVFSSRLELASAATAWCTNATSAELTHGPISAWNVSILQDFSYSFCGLADGDAAFLEYWGCDAAKASCNPPIGAWDTSRATSMYCALPPLPARQPFPARAPRIR